MAEPSPNRSNPNDQLPSNLLSGRDILLAQGPAPTGAGLPQDGAIRVVPLVMPASNDDVRVHKLPIDRGHTTDHTSKADTYRDPV